MMHYYGMGYGYIGLGWLFQILILILFFWVIWWVLKSSRSFGFRASNETAMEILKKRLASGEISEKEYQRLKREIED